MKIDYEKLSEITVKTQEELDMIPDNFRGRIYIEGSSYWNVIKVYKRYYYRVVARENSSVEAWGNSFVVAWENSSVVARENSSVEAWGNSFVEAWENSSVVARGNSFVVAWENSSVVAWENSSVEAWENSFVVARENSSVEAWENSFVEAWGNSSVVARENSSVEANANVQVVDYLQGAKIKVSGNARIVYMPKSINDFMDFYGIKHTKTNGTFYKAVHKCDVGFCSDYNHSFIYEIGKTYSEECDDDAENDCGVGLHIAPLNWALNFGCGWNNLAIIEVTTKIDDIVLPINTNGKVRTSKLKVVREVPLVECGVYGKILANRKQNKG